MPIRRPGGGVSTSELRQVEQRLENRILNVENICVEVRKGQTSLIRDQKQILDRLDKVDSRLDNLESMVQEILTLLSVEKVK